MSASYPEKLFSDDEGLQTFKPEDIPPDREVITTPYDAPVKTLIADITSKDLIVNPIFQRDDVWPPTKKSRLIESLLLNIPIPVLYFAEDDDGTRVVIDGQQRLRSIYDFVTGQFALSGLEVLSGLNRKRWVDLTARQARLIENRTLRCVVISAYSDKNLRFEMFQRLNTGGVTLNQQELRKSLFFGEFSKLLEELSNDRTWLNLLRANTPDTRMRHQELILRFFAFVSSFEVYKPPLKAFLNTFMKDNRNPDETQINEYKLSFVKTVSNVDIVFGRNAFRRFVNRDEDEAGWESALNRAAYDVQTLTLAELDSNILRARKGDIVNRFQYLCLNDNNFIDSISQATSDRSRLYTRLSVWSRELIGLGIESEAIRGMSRLEIKD